MEKKRMNLRKTLPCVKKMADDKKKILHFSFVHGEKRIAFSRENRETKSQIET